MIVTRALPADCDLLRLHRQAPARYPLLLQSTSSSLHAGHAQSSLRDGRSTVCARTQIEQHGPKDRRSLKGLVGVQPLFDQRETLV